MAGLPVQAAAMNLVTATRRFAPRARKMMVRDEPLG